MARADLINILYSANRTPLEFKFQSLTAPPLLSLISAYDIKNLNDIARDPRLSSKLTKKLEYIKGILEPRGFVKFHSGTNRVVYRFYEDQSFLIKIAFDKVALTDNPMEYNNQFLLAPFVTKVFEVSPCGTVGLFERVEPITSRQEFISIADDVFDLLNDKFIGKYVLEDIGSEYFMNWGIRLGFGPVLLDFPYCYELDGNKLYCNKVDAQTGMLCGGSIDYDNGFNNLICTKCGLMVFAKTLKKDIETKNIIVKGRREKSNMQVTITIPGKEPYVVNSQLSAKTYADNIRGAKSKMKVDIFNANNTSSAMGQDTKVRRDGLEIPINAISKDNYILGADGEKHKVTGVFKNESLEEDTSHTPIIKTSAPYGVQELEDSDEENEYQEETEAEENDYSDSDSDEYAVTDEDDQFEEEYYDDSVPVGVSFNPVISPDELKSILPSYEDNSNHKYPAKKRATTRKN